MSVNASLINLGSRFNAMSLRERGMIAAAILALLVLVWDQLLMGPLQARREVLTHQVEEVQKDLKLLTETIEGHASDNPMSMAMGQKQQLTQSLAAVDAQLQSASAGLIAPQRMLTALRDVLNGQHDLRLVSMRNLPVTSLAASNPAPIHTMAIPAGSTLPKPVAPVAASGPYVHSMELIVEGSYLEVLRYLQSVEALEWRFYWQVLELKTTEYPLNRVRIRLNTLSMDKEWLGV